MESSDNNPGYRQIRAIAGASCLGLLFLHFYFFCYRAFSVWKMTLPILDRIATNFARSGLFTHSLTTKLLALLCMTITLIGKDTGSGSPQNPRRRHLRQLAIGSFCYLGSERILLWEGYLQWIAGCYIVISLAGLLLLYPIVEHVVSRLSGPSRHDFFNRYNESFPQEERLLINPYSVNLRARYTFRNHARDSWVNLVNGFRGTLVCGNPGSGKTRYVFRQSIQQQITHGFTGFIFDWKYDDLTKLAYNTLERVGDGLPVKPAFHSINFQDFSRSERCNCLDPTSMEDISDALNDAKTILFGIDKKSAETPNDFFVKSALSFFTANIWFLRRYKNGKYCTLPHLIELIQTDYDKLFSILRSVPEIESLINSFVKAYLNGTMDQLQGQIDSAKIPLSLIASPQLYYLLSANDFTLDINNPAEPKIVCIGSNPAKQHVYGAIISLYVSRMFRLVNKKGMLPCFLEFDEISCLHCPDLDNILATGRQNKLAVTFGFQNISQLRKEYGREQADALFNLPGNIICGQVTGDTARLVSERFGRILQDKETVSTDSHDKRAGQSVSKSRQLDFAVPASRIANLSAGEFVGVVADNPDQRIDLKGFHCDLVIDHDAIEREEAAYKPLLVVRTVTPELIEYNFNQIKADVRQLVEDHLEYMRSTPGLAKLIVNKNQVQSRIKQTLV